MKIHYLNGSEKAKSYITVERAEKAVRRLATETGTEGQFNVLMVWNEKGRVTPILFGLTVPAINALAESGFLLVN